jgi:hypothetical protein
MVGGYAGGKCVGSLHPVRSCCRFPSVTFTGAPKLTLLTGWCPLLLPGGKPLLHSTNMAAWPIKTAAFRAHPQWTAGGPRPFRHLVHRIRRRRFEQLIVDGAAGERCVFPVNVESDPQGACGLVDAASRQQHDRCSIFHGCGKMPVLGQQDPTIFDAACCECAVGEPTRSNDSVITGRSQPSAETVQHLVAQKPRHLSNLSPHVVGSISPRCGFCFRA